ncbi:MAG: hypothetical protein Q9219_004418 [cf. Caloplaca sp. 3 TL-2023]
MADPLSIAVAVASSVATAGKLLNSINTYRTKFKAVDLAALSIKAQCDCILVALGQIQTALLSKQQLAARLMSDDSISGQSLKSVLGACEITFLVLVDKLASVDRCISHEARASSTKEKFSRLWNESEINELGQNISRLSDGLNLLLTALNTKSQLDVLEVLTSERASIIFEQVADDASSIFFSGPNESLISRVNSSSLDEDVLSQEVDPKDFSFDQEVLMTPAYRKIQVSSNRNQVEFKAECVELEDNGIGFIAQPVSDKEIERTTDSHDPEPSTAIPALLKLGESQTTPKELEVHGTTFTAPTTPGHRPQAVGPRASRENGERTITLEDFWPSQSRQSLATPLTWQRHKLWVTPKEVVIVGQDIQEIPGRIVDVICHIKSLKILHLSLNEIDSLPPNIGNLSSLEFLNVACNKLPDLPIALVNMPNLQTIYAHGNPYSSDRLQIWQAQHGTYYPFPSAAYQATIELKQTLRDDSTSASAQVDGKGSLQPCISDQEGSDHHPPESDVSQAQVDRFLKRFAKSSLLHDGNIDIDCPDMNSWGIKI